jgi:drug/metabolite transporter (DMT)-like permease
MWILLACIILNAFIGIIFKFYQKFGIDNLQAIIINYLTCVITASVVLGEWAIPSNLFEQQWIWIAIGLGVTFILVFNLMALTVQKFGVVVATIFQKMSLIAPTIIAIIYYNESSPFTKILGISFAIISIILLSYKKRDKDILINEKWLWLLPLSTFIGSCLIDVSLFLVEIEKYAPNGDIGFVATLFLFAGISGLIILFIKSLYVPQKINLKTVVGGIALGVPNFFSIYLLLLLLSKDWGASVVFPINNVGILVFSALFGYIFFKEKMNKLKLAGFILAVTSIILIAVF